MPEEKTIVVMPAFNEEKHIRGSVRYALSLVERGVVHEVVVIDDGSTDRTAELAGQAGAIVISKGHGGKGGAFLKGALYCKEREANILILMDADLFAVSGDPVASMIDRLEHAANSTSYNMVVAQTSEGGILSPHKYSGERAIRMKALGFLFSENGAKIELGKSKPALRFTEMCDGFGLELALNWQVRPAAKLPESEGLFKLDEAFRKGERSQMLRLKEVTRLIEARMHRKERLLWKRRKTPETPPVIRTINFLPHTQ